MSWVQEYSLYSQVMATEAAGMCHNCRPCLDDSVCDAMHVPALGLRTGDPCVAVIGLT